MRKVSKKYLGSHEKAPRHRMDGSTYMKFLGRLAQCRIVLLNEEPGDLIFTQVAVVGSGSLVSWGVGGCGRGRIRSRLELVRVTKVAVRCHVCVRRYLR